MSASLAADTPLAGANTMGLLANEYKVKTDGKELWIKLDTTEAGNLEADDKAGADNATHAGKITLSTGTWAGLNSAKPVIVSGAPPRCLVPSMQPIPTS